MAGIGSIDDLIGQFDGNIREAEAYCWKQWESLGKPEHSPWVATAISLANRYHGTGRHE